MPDYDLKLRIDGFPANARYPVGKILLSSARRLSHGIVFVIESGPTIEESGQRIVAALSPAT